MTTLAAIKHHGPYVFANPTTGTRYVDIWQSFNQARQQAGLTDFRFHDLRHTFASWAVQSGMDLYTLSRILGHQSVKMTTRYAHLTTHELHKAVRKMDETMRLQETHRRLAQYTAPRLDANAGMGRGATSGDSQPSSALTRELAELLARDIVTKFIVGQ